MVPLRSSLVTHLLRTGPIKRMDKNLSHHEYEKAISVMLMVDGPLRISTSYIGIGRILRVSSGPHFAHVLKSQIQSPAFSNTDDNDSPRPHSAFERTIRWQFDQRVASA